MPLFGLWEETGGSPHKHGENVETPQKGHSLTGMQTARLLGGNANPSNTVLPRKLVQQLINHCEKLIFP
ncbi:hypothetical protein EXN66_Car006031 [Channa argus]|uniref:Uncharacterized protein n=1 Tax=Channa argus TaxID=215402 RepID=A0A6G1PJF9_CHAAH|nr:hypothetical protein EXN66_Car006031 [Channa argus]